MQRLPISDLRNFQKNATFQGREWPCPEKGHFSEKFSDDLKYANLSSKKKLYFLLTQFVIFYFLLTQFAKSFSISANPIKTSIKYYLNFYLPLTQFVILHELDVNLTI